MWRKQLHRGVYPDLLSLWEPVFKQTQRLRNASCFEGMGKRLVFGAARDATA
jgi:hypothetical protein